MQFFPLITSIIALEGKGFQTGGWHHRLPLLTNLKGYDGGVFVNLVTDFIKHGPQYENVLRKSKSTILQIPFLPSWSGLEGWGVVSSSTRREAPSMGVLFELLIQPSHCFGSKTTSAGTEVLKFCLLLWHRGQNFCKIITRILMMMMMMMGSQGRGGGRELKDTQ